MESIVRLTGMICEEIEGVRCVLCGLKTRDFNAAALVFAEIANRELGHIDKLYDLVTDAISEVR